MILGKIAQNVVGSLIVFVNANTFFPIKDQNFCYAVM
jgi:hypothetical protein